MVSKDKIMIDYISSDQFDLYIDTIALPPPAKRKQKTIQIPGRFESLEEAEEEYEDIVIPVTAYVFDNNYNVNAMYAWLRSGTILITNHSEHFYKIKDVSVSVNYKGHQKTGFSILFKCSPFRYERGESVITVDSDDATIENKGNYYSEPTFIVRGTGDVEIQINGSRNKLQIKNMQKDTHINVEKRLVYYTFSDGSIEFVRFSGKFPYLSPGINTMHWSGENVSAIDVFVNARWL